MRRLLVPIVGPCLGAVLIAAALYAAVGAAPATSAPAPAAPADPRALPGWALYDRLCLACHGASGDGGGPAAPWLWPRPRDLTRGDWKWRSTPVGAPATDEDLAATIRWGVPGATSMAMPAFGGALDDAQIADLVAVVRALAGEPADTRPAAPATVPALDAADDAAIARGRALWGSLGCTACHGDGGAGDGPAAGSLRGGDGRPNPPYDLTTEPLRRPHAPGGARDALYRSIAFGLAGTAMPGFDSVPPDDLVALVAYVDSIRWRGAPGTRPGPLAPEAIAADRDQRLARAGFWPGHADDPDAAPFGGEIPHQGAPPAALAPAQASLSSRQCARCHAKQAREWTGSIHADAASPGFFAQVARQSKPAAIRSCYRCHAPLAEQQAVDADGAPNPRLDDDLRHEGLTCAACHVRGHVRHGPTTIAASLLPLDGYPKAGLAIYERSDLCLPCHQLEPRGAVAGRPLLDTYREWAAGPYMARGIQCQHCHMPNREHTFKGVHDPDTFRQGYRLEVIAARGATGVVSVRARLWNVGAGHMLPTTPTPAAWLEIALVDARGREISGATATRRIGRQIEFTGGRWVEHEDTRVAPGEAIEVAGGWKAGRVGEATHARITVRVHPDDFYEGVYRARLKAKGKGAATREVRAWLEEALDKAEGRRYVAEERLVEID